jgi:D-sedoheptulose 7-phosphate isomerase
MPASDMSDLARTVSTAEHALASRYLDHLRSALGSLDLACIDRMSSVLARCYDTGSTVFLVGNGGSASTASHLAADFMKLSSPPNSPRRLRSLCLADSMASLTAASNDFSYDEGFVEQLRGLMQPGDVVLGISTSGRSPNVMRALEYAASRGATVMAITGERGTGLRTLTHETLVIDSNSVQRVEDITLVAGHIICLMVRARCHPDEAGVASAN